MDKTRDEQVRKRVDFVAKDSAERVATGIVMVPDKVDLQGDFAREDTIRGFAEQFAALEEVGDAGGGVMHAVWPDDHISLDANRVLDEGAEIGGAQAPAGAWVQEWHFPDDELWSLVEDGVLEGYSIGAVDVVWSNPMDQGDLPDDVAVAENYPDDDPVWELRDGIVREVSAVDIPAVPDAEILQTKADAEKRLADHLGSRDAFLEEAMGRGHSEAEAERLWDYLNRAIEADGSGEPGKQSVFHRVGKAAMAALTGTDDDDTGSKTTSEDLDRGTGADKEGRTLSRANRDALFASIDSQLDVLEDAGIDHGATRFTDRDDVDFDLAEYAGRTWDDGTEASADGHDSGGDTPGSDDTTMGDDPDKSDDIESLEETVKALQERLDELEEKHADGDADADKDADGDDAVGALEEKIDQLETKIDNLAEASGKSQQLDGGAQEGGDDRTKADVLGLGGGA